VGIHDRPRSVYEGTGEAEVLILIAEGVCNTFREFPSCCELTQAQVRRTLDGLRKKHLIIYLPHGKAWKVTRAGLKSYEEVSG